MKKTLAGLTVLIALYAMPALAATTLTGTVTDDMCGAQHMMPGKPDATCARACVKRGAKWALASGGKVYILSGKTTEVDALAGHTVVTTKDLQDTLAWEGVAIQPGDVVLVRTGTETETAEISWPGGDCHQPQRRCAARYTADSEVALAAL